MQHHTALSKTDIERTNIFLNVSKIETVITVFNLLEFVVEKPYFDYSQS